MKPRLLFVDDDAKLLKGIQRALSEKRDAWNMVFAEGGRNALELMDRMRVDVVVTDLRMPGMDGVEFLNRVRYHFPKTGRLVLSGETEESLTAASLGVAQQYLFKPCDPSLLISTLEAVLQKRHMAKGVFELISG